MNDVAMWIAVIGLLALLAVVILGLLLDGAYQVATGRPGFNPLPRMFRKRVPGTELDYVRQGAYGMLQATALLFIEIPSSYQLISSTATLTGVVEAPQGPRSHLLAGVVLAVTGASLVVGMVLLIAAWVISQKVKYAPVATQGAQNQPTR